MCTLVVGFYPQAIRPLVIAANRDENPTRPSEPWGFTTTKDGPVIFCPKDVRGGTWIGCSSAGIFCAITNWDVREHTRGLMSRGNIVLETLALVTKEDILRFWYTINPKNYNPFNIIAGSQEWLAKFSCSQDRSNVNLLPAGLHISTGWGLNTDTIRENHIRKVLRNAFCYFSSPVSSDALIKVMSDHNAGEGSEDSVCVHDEQHKWETRSSTYIGHFDDSFLVRWTDCPPCKTTPERWEARTIPLYYPSGTHPVGKR